MKNSAEATQRIRRTPYTSRVDAAGVSSYSVYNHMLLPTVFESVEADYEHLVNFVQVWDVSCQRQVELQGVDAARLAQLITPRDLSKTQALQGKYAPLCDERGAVMNDPIIIKLAEQRWWLSIADADIKLWVKGLAYGLGLRVKVFEPDVWPLAVQGPLAEQLMERVFGSVIREIKFFRGASLPFRGKEMLVMRSGWSKQGGFEIYLNDFALGEPLWDELFHRGEDLQVRAGCPNQIERIESGLLSYGADMNESNNPFECGLGQYVDLEADVESMSLPALRQLAGRQERELTAIAFPEEIDLSKSELVENGQIVGRVTAQAWSPKYKEFIVYAMMETVRLEASSEIVINGLEGRFVPLVRKA